jgi:hypothetical protein
MLYVYGFCNGSASAAVEEHRVRFPTRRILDRRMFFKVLNMLREYGSLPSVHVSSEWAIQHHMEEQENIFEMVQLSHPTSKHRLSTRLSVS